MNDMTLTLREVDLVDIIARGVRLYAETHPRPACVLVAEAAEMIGISRGTLYKMIRSGEVRINAAGRIPMTEIDRVIAVGGKTIGRGTTNTFGRLGVAE